MHGAAPVGFAGRVYCNPTAPRGGGAALASDPLAALNRGWREVGPDFSGKIKSARRVFLPMAKAKWLCDDYGKM